MRPKSATGCPSRFQIVSFDDRVVEEAARLHGLAGAAALRRSQLDMRDPTGARSIASTQPFEQRGPMPSVYRRPWRKGWPHSRANSKARTSSGSLAGRAAHLRARRAPMARTRRGAGRGRPRDPGDCCRVRGSKRGSKTGDRRGYPYRNYRKVHGKGLEPLCLAAAEPKSAASASFATRALRSWIDRSLILPAVLAT
jgi:hypothetical protein